jgi:heme-degrading monooxygenase HmoA
MAFQLAQINIGRTLEPLESERLRGFVEMLEPINALADTAPGFVWRLQTEDGDATALRPFDDDQMIINMSVWATLESYADFVYGPQHSAVMRQRKHWFETMRIYTCAWWIPAGTIPTPDEAIARLAILERSGPTPEAFTVRRPFPAPDAIDAPDVREDWVCPV